MGDTATPSSIPDDDELIVDFARYSEGILDEKFLRRKYHFVDDRTWELLGQDESLIEKIELCRARRVRSGATKRELAQKHMVRAPDVLNNIMSDPNANHRHVVDAIKTLDALADPGPERAPASDERFSIVINLGNDEKIRIDKQIGRVDPHAGESLDHAPQELLPMIAAKKDNDDGSRGGAW